jgi:PST family polysaccharide transporter
MAMLGQMQSVVGILNGVVTAPVGNGVVKYTAQYQSQGFKACAPWWAASIRWLAITTLITTSITAFFSKQISLYIFDKVDYSWIIVLIAATLPLSGLGTLFSSVLNGLHKYKKYILVGMISTIISTIFMIYLIKQHQLNGALIAVISFYAISSAITLICVTFESWIHKSYWFCKTNKSTMKNILFYMLMAITSSVCTPIALIMIRNDLVNQVGWEQTGYWQAVYKISEVYLSVITLALSTYLLPKLSSIRSLNDLNKETLYSGAVILPLVSAMALLIYFFRDYILQIAFSDSFSDASNLFLIQLIGDVLKIASWLYSFRMISHGFFSLFFISEVFFSLSFVVLAHYLIRTNGVDGANIAYTTNYLIYFLFSIVFIRKKQIN